MGKRSPRLQFTEEERASPELKKSIRKADKKADKLEKAEAKIPKKTVKRKERVVDADGKVTTRLYFEEVDKKKPPSKLSHAAETAPINSALAMAHREIRQSEKCRKSYASHASAKRSLLCIKTIRPDAFVP